MKCEKCGKQINNLLVDIFTRDGSDRDFEVPISEHEVNAVAVEVNHNWVGDELSEEEQKNTIRCPYCKQFPFESEEIQTEEVVRIICFKKENNS